MKFTQLGRTGLRVSRLCLGCMSYGTPSWRPWVLNEEASQPFFRRAVELGINFFDTADMYSLGVSEEVTGRALRRYARMEEVVLATKVYFPMGDGPNMRGLSRKHIVQACEASLKRLGVETIDLYQIHRMDPHTPLEETLAALDQLVNQGKVRYLGASSTFAWQFARALGVADLHGWSRFVSMQDHYNLVYREEEREMLPLCEAEGIGVIPWSPLARGLLAGSRKSLTDRSSTTRAKTDAYAPVLYDQPGDWEVAEANRKVAEARNVPPAQVALAWLLSRPVVTAPIIGATKPEHLEDAVRAVDLKLTAEELQQLEAPYQPHALRGM
ncbi:aldo/keto reductase [Myxococcus sp. MISCRS1]|uniref:aldo/keto reductase n=1 Tax=Myxococcus TaxID=32 RepID=UPI001CBB9891|nr:MULTISPECIES: aldo/keto reductase [unclassified Myxococcus]MBZ4399618.1 aldo/keto reductase [Myxococcus sp. AS-1-15]MBZ4412101.1 aldo/keto reductase [Myxococcus sp. XM-1-1-1]MCY0995606.1 aldo/keto reductase [Myxococcus sp. MISCRS1]BDT34409.1 aldo/keto reductase [Myxococcus sp. MH1]